MNDRLQNVVVKSKLGKMRSLKDFNDRYYLQMAKAGVVGDVDKDTVEKFLRRLLLNECIYRLAIYLFHR